MLFELGMKADRLIDEITDGFSGVKLGVGIGLREAQGLDNYETEEVCALNRERDEKEDWSKISSNDLNECYSSLSFFDSLGLRFHLPAFMVAELRGEYEHKLSFCFTYLKEHCRKRFDFLSPDQRGVVRRFLMFLLEHPDYEFDREDIERALEVYWR